MHARARLAGLVHLLAIRLLSVRQITLEVPAVAHDGSDASLTLAGRPRPHGRAGDMPAVSAAAPRLFRQMLQMKRHFAFDPERAKSQLDMPHLLHTRVRAAFEASRGEADPQKVQEMVQSSQPELEALQTICSNAFFKKVRRCHGCQALLTSRISHLCCGTRPTRSSPPRDSERRRKV